jgi:glycerophosphoryl diester phosphodiesterase
MTLASTFSCYFKIINSWTYDGAHPLKKGNVVLRLALAKLALIFFLPLIFVFGLHAQIIPLPNAHSHNDYEQSRPLFLALENGFTSFEADIHLIDGELYVTHDHPETLNPNLTLKALYLEPLKKRIELNKGRVYANYNKPVYLLIDVKTEAKSTLQALERQVAAYAGMVAHKSNPQGALKIILSGNRDMDYLLKDTKQFIRLDGRPSDLPKKNDAQKMPLISENYGKLVSWKGQDEISSKEFRVLADLAEEAHRQGKLFRLWATPEDEKVWETLLKAGVDLLNTDDLPRLRAFLTTKELK